jgi:succinate-semialdehyde dehydrogenase/glutarate-semialdehyde dehydrogenase
MSVSELRSDNDQTVIPNLKDPSLLKDQCYVAGAWTGTPDLPVTNPATGALIVKVPRFGTAETAQAIDAAHEAFASWSQMLAAERCKLVRRWYELQMEHLDDLALIMTTEQGKPLAEAKGEVAYAAGFTEFYSEEGKRAYGETIPTHRKDARIVVINQPIGVVGAITPWNFPMAMITRKVAPAISVGCTVVSKPASETPLTALALAELAHRAGIPKGVFNVIVGKSSEIGKELTTSKKVRMITFTGSTEVGRLLMEQSASTIKQVGMELGGNAPLIVFDDADLDQAVAGTMASKFRNTGQTCVCANRILVQEGVYDEFAEKLTKAVAAMKVGEGTEDGVAQGPLINQAALEKVEAHVENALKGGAKVLTGGKRHERGGTFYEPTVLTDVTTDMLFNAEETFGPMAPLQRFKTEDEAIAIANDSDYGLSAYFFARDIGRIWRVGEALEAGIVGINEGVISTPIAPFGGMKESGIGREGSHHGIEEFLEMKYMLMGGL